MDQTYTFAAAHNWLDYYKAKSLKLLDLYSEDAVITCGCGCAGTQLSVERRN